MEPHQPQDAGTVSEDAASSQQEEAWALHLRWKLILKLRGELERQQRREKYLAPIREYQREYRNCPEVRERRRKENREYSQRPEVRKRLRERQREHRKTPEVREQKQKEWSAYYQRPEVKQRLREYRRRPEVRKRKNERNRLRNPWDLTVNSESVAAMLEAQKCLCANRYCRCDISEKYQLDHVHPESKGGPSTLGNLQLLCRACNSSKSDRTPAEWEAYAAQRAT